MAYLQFIGSGDELWTIPKRSTGLDGETIDRCSDGKSKPSQHVIDKTEVSLVLCNHEGKDTILQANGRKKTLTTV